MIVHLGMIWHMPFFELQVAAMVKNGFLRLLVQFDKMAEYWDHMLKEFPDHPAANMVSSSVPLSLYGALMAIYIYIYTIYDF